jgi:hypothetical protein
MTKDMAQVSLARKNEALSSNCQLSPHLPPKKPKQINNPTKTSFNEVGK